MIFETFGPFGDPRPLQDTFGAVGFADIWETTPVSNINFNADLQLDAGTGVAPLLSNTYPNEFEITFAAFAQYDLDFRFSLFGSNSSLSMAVDYSEADDKIYLWVNGGSFGPLEERDESLWKNPIVRVLGEIVYVYDQYVTPETLMGTSLISRPINFEFFNLGGTGIVDHFEVYEWVCTSMCEPDPDMPEPSGLLTMLMLGLLLRADERHRRLKHGKASRTAVSQTSYARACALGNALDLGIPERRTCR